MNNIDNLTSMVVFARVVETLSFTEAAKSLRLSKSSVSREIAQLEVRLSTQLLNRTTRKIQVTEVGMSYYQYCHRILTEAQNAEHFIRNFHEEPMGSLRLIAPVSFGSQCVVPALNHFIAGNIHISVDLELTDKAINMEEDQCDIAVIIGRATPYHPLIMPLIDITWGLYATPDYLRQFSPIDKPEDLPRYDYLLFRGPAHTLSLPFRKERHKLDIEVRSRFRINNSVALMSSALAGAGIAYLPDYVTHEPVAEGRLVRLLPEWNMDIYQAWMLFKSESTLSARVQHFASSLQNKLKQNLVNGKKA
ncbi:LysR family transcriptional regulator [Xenorhabdus nematophila]|nr:LysR family transcriptional regulator [Xenorhabdus nematophila]CEE91917.1 putative transcriptional regulator (LysR family) [Xenorhabdus nematophila str. Anatoliense]CEF31046.1 putative transcriptional regulator (LysR family) [Xenorhabdus nematophila str. Websteri]AYA42395.1 LysR family transcriptional regulator [Xenorhabdus nematophila]KHD28383.1 LysR family transcriptional regulator [Xenorhabdus nematophila]MBA0017853.1 LysR family transcriptional regulator [Xenorhabdus nematophila]